MGPLQLETDEAPRPLTDIVAALPAVAETEAGDGEPAEKKQRVTKSEVDLLPPELLEQFPFLQKSAERKEERARPTSISAASSDTSHFEPIIKRCMDDDELEELFMAVEDERADWGGKDPLASCRA